MLRGVVTPVGKPVPGKLVDRGLMMHKSPPRI